MAEKNWITYETEINGLKQEVKFSAEAVEKVFKPFLKKLGELHAMMDRKIVAYIAAPPGAGKTALAQFLEKISREEKFIMPVRALGLDGFHHTAEYLQKNKSEIDGKEILLNDIKGAPETFDVDNLQFKLREVRQEGTNWNIYDRKIHDVVHNVLSVEDEIILLEGNYLLLKDSHWTNIRVLADYTVFIKAAPELLKERLISRKVQGGLSREDAEKFYFDSDSKNVERVLKNSSAANETWQLLEDGDFIKIADEDDEEVYFEDLPEEKFSEGVIIEDVKI